MKTFPVSCNKDCGGGCPLTAHVENGRITRISNNPAGSPYMKGCLKGFRAYEMDNHPGRLTRPLIRKERSKRPFLNEEDARRDFREASWEEALDLAARRLTDFREGFGCRAMMDLSSGGSCRGAVHDSSALTGRFLHFWGGSTRLDSNYSSGAVSFVTPYVYGTKMTGMDAGNLRHSRLILLWGYNPEDTRFGCEFPPRIREARKRGARIIVIDPRESRSARTLADQWISLRPGTDAALMAALLYRLIDTNRINRPFIETYSTGFDRLEEYILGKTDGLPKTPGWASDLCGIPEETVTELADLYGATRPAALLPGLSIQRAVGGEEAARMAMALQTATGNVGIPGGSSGSTFWGRMSRPRCGTIPLPRRNEEPAVPVYQWPDAVLEGTGGGWPSEIRGAYVTGSNLLMQGSDINKNLLAFNKLELTIGHDFFLTPTMAMCDIVFPVASFLEREDIVFPAGNFLLYSAKAVEPPEGVRTDYEIFTALADRIGFAASYTEDRTAGEWVEKILTESDVPDPEEFKRTGIFRGEEDDRNGLSGFIGNPRRNPLPTPSGKIELAPEAYGKLGFPPWPHYRGRLPADPAYPLSLVTPHPLQGIHSQFGNIPGFRQEEDLGIWIHPSDAEERGIGKGETVLVVSPEGRLTIPARITDGIHPGVVSLNEGLWPRLIRQNGRVTDTGGSANMVTSTEPTMPSRSARTHTVFVNLRKIPTP